MKPWSHLPNADLIDWVIESLKCNPELWAAALNAVCDAILNAAWDAALRAARDAAHNAAWDAAYKAARDAAYNAARDAALRAARDAAYKAALNATRDAGWIAAHNAAYNAAHNAVHGAILALIAYDDCRQYLDMSYEQLLAWAHLSERSQAVLLLPLKWVQEHEALVTST